MSRNKINKKYQSEDMQQHQQSIQQHYLKEPPMLPVPPHMLGPGGFSALHYFHQPSVMLTSLVPVPTDGPGPGPGSGPAHFPTEIPHYPSNVQDIKPLTDLLAQQHQPLQSGNKSRRSSSSSGNELRLYKCLTCGREFKQKNTLHQHERIHTDSRPYDCPECDKRFRQQSHLTQHLRIHENKKPYDCLFCDRSFRQRVILNQHLRIHSGEKPYVCGECGKNFRQKAILNSHARTHRGDHHVSLLNCDTYSTADFSVIVKDEFGMEKTQPVSKASGLGLSFNLKRGRKKLLEL